MAESFFRLIIERVQAMKPGETITVSADLLEPPAASAVASFLQTMTGFTQVDRVLENVIGSARTHRYRRYGYHVIYERFHIDLPEGIRGYVSPDRLTYFEKRPDGLYVRKGFIPSHEDEGRVLCALRGHDMQPAYRHAPLDARYIPTDPSSAIFELIRCQKCSRCEFTLD